MKETFVKIKLSDVKPNPNRDLAFNPYNEEKIAALMASIGETGFWTNVIVREQGNSYEQAYGHHRIESARRCGITEADFVVRELDENMMLKMMELENQEDYRYCPLSLLESVKAVVKALAEGRITLSCKVEEGAPQAAVAADAYLRYAPSFMPGIRPPKVEGCFPYSTTDVARFLGMIKKPKREGVAPSSKVIAALDALYLLEVKAINVATIKDMNWSQLSRYVADAKAHRERTVLRTVKTKDEIAKLNAEALRIQAEQKAKEKTIADAKAALVKKLAEAKREGDAKAAKEAKERMAVKEAEAEKAAETFEVKKAALNVKVAEVKQKEVTAKEEDKYLPVRKEADRIVHKLERRDEEAEIKALARRPLNANDRERLRQAALKLGEWYNTWVADLFLPPLSTKSSLAEYRNREEAKRRAESKETK